MAMGRWRLWANKTVRVLVFLASLTLTVAAAWYFRSVYFWEPSDEKPRVTIKQLVPGREHAYLYMGKENLFQGNGFDVEIAGGSGSELSAKLTAAGEAEFGLMGPDALLGVVQEGGKLISLGVVYDKTPVVIYSLKKKT